MFKSFKIYLPALFSLLNSNQNEFYSFVSRLTTLLLGSLFYILVPLRLTSIELGYYFTFQSLLGLQIIFEMGFSYVLLQNAAHESSRLELSPHGWGGASLNLTRLKSLFAIVSRYYTLACVLFFFSISAGGYLFFSRVNAILFTPEIQVIWIMLTLISAINLYISPWTSMVEGMNGVVTVSILKSFQVLVGYLLAIVFLFFGAGLYSILLIGISSVFVYLFWYRQNSHYFNILDLGICYERNKKINFFREIFPFQVKIAITWICGYIGSQTLPIFVFSFSGAVIAGQLGFTMLAFNSLMLLTYSIFNSNIPSISACISTGDFYRAKRIFKKSFVKSFVLTFSTGMCLLLAIFYFQYMHFAISSKFSNFIVCTAVFGITMLSFVSYCVANYVRSFKKEGFILPTILSAILIPVLFLSPIKSDISYVMSVFLILQTFINLPFVAYNLKLYFFNILQPVELK